MDEHLEKFINENSSELVRYTKEHLEVLRPLLKEKGIQRVVEYAYNYIDAANKQAGVNELLTCSKGCHFCCYGEIGLTGLEASYITSYIGQFNVDFDKEASKAQQLAPFAELKHKDKKCVMINKEGACSIYDIRPSVCRIHNSTSPPKQCDEKDGKISTQVIRLLETFAMTMALQSLSADDEHYKLHKVIYSQNVII